jgi:capsid protein
MPLLTNLASAARRMLNTFTGYDAVKDLGRRKRAHGINKSEDQELTPYDRFRLYTAGRDLARNFSVAAWAIRKHLDYVSTFSFHPKCAEPDRNAELLAWRNRYARKENCDTAGRHNLDRIIRLSEAARTTDGDILIVKIADGRVQAIEGDRLRTPPGGFPAGVCNPIRVIHGIETDEAGRALRYAVCRRSHPSDYSTAAGMFYFDRMVDADNAWLHGYFSRFDQYRGISPLASGYNSLRDVYEGVDYALAKAKAASLFAMAIYRADDAPMGQVSPIPQSQVPVGTQIDYGQPDDSGLRVDFGRGPVFLDLNKDDEAEFLQSNHPSNEFQQFTNMVIGMALKALDIPFSFYDESWTNFSGARQAWIQYELTAREKRKDNLELLDNILEWRIAIACEDGELTGQPEDYRWRHVSQGVPWIDPLKEVQADCQAVSAGFTSRQRVCRENGDDFFEIADEIAEENQYLVDKGIPTAIQLSNVQINENVSETAEASA